MGIFYHCRRLSIPSASWERLDQTCCREYFFKRLAVSCSSQAPQPPSPRGSHSEGRVVFLVDATRRPNDKCSAVARPSANQVDHLQALKAPEAQGKGTASRLPVHRQRRPQAVVGDGLGGEDACEKQRTNPLKAAVLVKINQHCNLTPDTTVNLSSN